MRRMTGIFGGSPKAPEGETQHLSLVRSSPVIARAAASQQATDVAAKEELKGSCYDHQNTCAAAYTGGNPDSNTLISDMTTVICLDDYHCLDR